MQCADQLYQNGELYLLNFTRSFPDQHPMYEVARESLDIYSKENIV